VSIRQIAKDIVEDAFDKADNFPPEKDSIERHVNEKISDKEVLPEDAVSQLREVRKLDIYFNPHGLVSTQEYLTYAWQTALYEEAHSLIDSYLEQAQEQSTQWEAILDSFENLGTSYNFRYFEYAQHHEVSEKLFIFSQAVEDYTNAPEEQRVLVEARMNHLRLVSIGYPSSTEASDWQEFAECLHNTSMLLMTYVVDYGLDDPAIEQHGEWRKMLRTFTDNTLALPLEQDNWEKLRVLLHSLRVCSRALNEYINKYES
jgi:hypothetical protein